MTPTELKEQTRGALERRINQEVFSGRFGKPDVALKLTVEAAIDAYADACVAEALAGVCKCADCRDIAEARAPRDQGNGDCDEMTTMRERLRASIGFPATVVVWGTMNEDEVIAFTESEVNRAAAETRASIVAWIRGTDARIAAQAKAGVVEVHYMHTIGLRDAARQLAVAIEAEADKETAK